MGIRNITCGVNNKFISVLLPFKLLKLCLFIEIDQVFIEIDQVFIEIDQVFIEIDQA